LMQRRALSVFAAALVSFAVSAAPSERTKTEISYLFNHLKSSGCKFNRNGHWYAAAAASDHLRTKYDYLLKEGMIGSTESFVERAAARSSITGKPYLVQCPGAAPVESATWFRAELAKLRAANPSKR
jgi:hypothetical protein